VVDSTVIAAITWRKATSSFPLPPVRHSKGQRKEASNSYGSVFSPLPPAQTGWVHVWTPPPSGRRCGGELAWSSIWGSRSTGPRGKCLEEWALKLSLLANIEKYLHPPPKITIHCISHLGNIGGRYEEIDRLVIWGPPRIIIDSILFGFWSPI